MSWTLRSGGDEREVSGSLQQDSRARLSLGGRELEVSELTRSADTLSFVLDGQRYDFAVLQQGGRITLSRDGQVYSFEEHEPGAQSGGADERGGELHSRMPGKILALLVDPGAQVHKGQPLLILEAMKMEHEVNAPADGVVRGFPKSQGERVMPGELLVDFEPIS